MPKPRKRKQANPFEQLLGLHGTTSARAQDVFTNASARQGYGTPSLGQGAEYTLVRISYDYWSLITLFRNHWLSRRIVEVPAQDMIKAWPRLTSDIEPKDITRIDRAIRKTNTKNNILTGVTWGRLFGGAGGLMVIDGQENDLDQPLDLESIKIGAYKGIIPFDRWAGISPNGDVCTDINRPLDFNKPEMYEVRTTGGSSFNVHASRLLRFLGPTVPTPELEAQSYWGISVLEPAYESITMLDNVNWNILGLTFRANLLGMKFPELAQLLSGLGSSQVASQKFEARMSAVNQLMSNQSLIPLPADGGIESTQYSFGGLGEIFQLFQLNLAGAAQVPVTRLFGRTYNGLGQTGDGDERIYEEKIATDQATYLVPQLEKLYPVICMSELGEVPDDLDLVCPSIRVLDEKEKSDLAKSVADTVTVYLNGGIMSPRVVAREVKQSSDITGIGTNLTDEDIEKLSDEVSSEGELGQGLFGGEGAGLGEADTPEQAVKSENKTGQGKDPEDPEIAKKEMAEKAGKATKAAPAMDALPSGLKLGEKVLVSGKLLTVAAIGDAIEDLDGETAVPVRFTDGSIVAYARATDSILTERCGKPAWKTCGDCGGRLHRTECRVALDESRDCVCRGLMHGASTYEARHGSVGDSEEFKESEHPRAENGQFGSGGGASGSSTLKSYASKEEWPEHVKALKLPPAWTDVKVSTDPEAALQAVGKDTKGRAQYVYSKKFSATQAALKFERIAALQKDMPLIDNQLAKLRKATDTKLRNHGDCMTLVQKLGVRPGSDEDTKAKVKAYGASTLEGKHVVVDGKEVRLKFTGKKGVAIDIPVTDPALAKNLRERSQAAGSDGRLFPGVTGASLLETAHSLDHGGYKTKDFRTHLATETASDLVKSMPVPKTEKEYKKQVLDVAKTVSAKLGNTPTVALQSYIAPQTFADWRQACGT